MKMRTVENMWCAIPPDKSCVVHVTYWRSSTMQALVNNGSQTWKELYRGGWRIVRCFVQPMKPTESPRHD